MLLVSPVDDNEDISVTAHIPSHTGALFTEVCAWVWVLHDILGCWDQLRYLTHTVATLTLTRGKLSFQESLIYGECNVDSTLNNVRYL